MVRHAATASPFISNFVKEASSVPLHQLPEKLESFPQHWPFPRGDLYHWIALLDRFDHVLELFNKEYGLSKGPQQEPFECRLLKKGDALEGLPYPATGAQQVELDGQSYSEEGDRQLVEVILSFTRTLLEHCGNRSLYSSSSHLSDLLHTTSYSLLRLCLRLSLRLAQRYQVARYKNSHPQAQAILLQNHYNINLDRLQKIAQPFPRPTPASLAEIAPAMKGKERRTQINPSDLVMIAKENKLMIPKLPFRDVTITYYDQSSATTSRPGSAHQPTEASPVSPTPVRRPSTLGPSRDRPSVGDRSNSAGHVTLTPTKSKDTDDAPSSAPKTYTISAEKFATTPDWQVVKDALADIPADSGYDLLNRVRIAKAFALTTVPTSLQEAVAVRLLAVANLGCALSESKFQERIGQADHEEPKRYHLAQQLCDLLQPATHDQETLLPSTEIAIFHAIESLSKLRHKSHEISDCLQISQNHGILYYELRKVVASLSEPELPDRKQELEAGEWREAIFDLTNTLLQSNTYAKPGERMVSAGIMSILVEILSLRTSRAERLYEKTLQFFDSFIHGVPTAFQTLASIKGFDIIAELTSYEVTRSLELAKNSNGLSQHLKSKVVDYDIPFYQQATLRQLFKFVTHMFEHNAGTHDRLLRNLIDTPQILGALRNVIDNAPIFGSNVWSGAVNIMSSFIHNEPTSFQVVSEAGLVKSLLQTVVTWELEDHEDFDFNIADVSTDLQYTPEGELIFPEVPGILPVGETMCDIPTAFGAICLNENGMKMFQSSKALLKYMDIFVSEIHVRALEEESQTAAAIGQAFDELSRHHPQLKEQIMNAVITMVRRVAEVCNYLGARKGMGAKLWERTTSGIAVEGRPDFNRGQTGTSSDDKGMIGDLNESEEHRVEGIRYINACFKFLDGFLHNERMRTYFCEQGGAVLLIKLILSPSNPHDLVAFPIFSKITQVLKVMCDAKPHLVLPPLISVLNGSTKHLEALVDNEDPQGAFATFTDLSKPQIAPVLSEATGTSIVKALSILHMLTHILARALAPPTHQPTSRHNPPPNQIFLALNFTDVYIDLVDRMSKIYSACLWENLVLQKTFSDDWKQQTDPQPFKMRRVNAGGLVELAAETRTDGQSSSVVENGASHKSAAENREDALALQNAKTLRYLLSQAPMGIEAFFHALGQALTLRRAHPDPSTKQHSFLVAEHIAEALARELREVKFGIQDDLMKAKYTMQVATACSRILLRNTHNPESWGSKEALSIVLSKFYYAGGFEALNGSLQYFTDVLTNLPEKSDALGNYARDVLTTILNFYSQIVKSKIITDAAQSNVSGKSDIGSADFFLSSQMVIEVRNAVLPAVSSLWESSALEHIADHHAKTIIDILRTILKADGEEKALDRSRKATRKVHASNPEFKFRETDLLKRLTSNGSDEKLAREGLYRNNYNEVHAREYCRLMSGIPTQPSFPLPGDKTETPAAPAAEQTADAPEPNADSDETVHASEPPTAERRESVEMTDATAPPPATSDGVGDDDGDDDSDGSHGEDAMSDDQPLRDALAEGSEDPYLPPIVDAGAEPGEPVRQPNGSAVERTRLSAAAPLLPKDTGIPYVTIEDLDEKRATLREDLIDRCLEVLSEQPDVTFDLADLIQAAVSKSGEASSTRAEIGTTLLNSLLSLQGGDSTKEYGAKVAAYAHLVALILQDRDFFDSTLDELKECFDALIAWIAIEQDQKAEDMPWIEMILLILERVLAEDEQPKDISWRPPPADDPLQPLPAPTPTDLVVPPESRTMLFEALLDLLPKVGKNSSLALSVSRVLVTLTRRREMALRLSEKASMSRLFLMIRQLAGSVDEKLHGAFMIILRHMVEDETILHQIMRTEIRAAFETSRSSRAMDSSTYSRNLYHLVLRDPELFAKVTEEMVEVPRFDGNPHRAQTLALKKDLDKVPTPEEPAQATEQTAEQITETDANTQKSVEAESADASKAAEAKPPTVEVTDGVIQFLLRELSNYRDVEDKTSSTFKELAPSPQTNGTSGDVEMADASTSTATAPAHRSDSSSKTEKPVFKPEEHTIYIYRCFVLQCLAELLASYQRTKIEFINFSRKPETQPVTPSKPRAGTLNYLLNVLIPIGTLEHRDDIAHRKRTSTSNWAIAVVVSLCSKTTEFRTLSELSNGEISQEMTDLIFVRKFVLEHALRAFKEATASTEQLDLRYSRLLALGDLFNKVLGSKRPEHNTNHLLFSHGSIGKLMYERNFIPALTSAIAELDLNFPNAKRTVKYLLAPLKHLTELGVWLSQHTDLSSSGTGTTDEEEISSATSQTDDEEDEREQTPDLYRNSTLGMFESSANHDEESGSGSEEDEDEDEIFDDGYDEEMDYEGMGDHGDVISDEDEEIEGEDGMGPIEGMPGDVEMDVDIVVEDDEDDMGDDDDDSNSFDEDDNDHDEDFDNQMDEITGDDENASMPDHEVGTGPWEDDDDEEEDEEDDDDLDDVIGNAIMRDAGSPHGGPLDALARVVAGDDDFDGMLAGDPGDVITIDVDNPDEAYFEDEMPPDEDDGTYRYCKR